MDPVAEDDDDELDGKKKKGKKGVKKGGKKKKKNKKKVIEEEIEYDDDGHVIIPQPLQANLRFRLIQLTHSQKIDTSNDIVEVTDEELVFVAYMMDPSEVEAEEDAYEAEGPVSMMPPPTGRASAVLPPTVAKCVQALHPKRNNILSTQDDEDGVGGDDEEDLVRKSSYSKDEEDEETEEVGRDKRHSSTYSESQVKDGGDEEDDNDVSKIDPLELRMDLTTLMAFRCPWALQRALMTHGPLPSMANIEAWIEILCETLATSSDEEDAQSIPDEFRTIVRNLVEATRLSIEAKKPTSPPAIVITQTEVMDDDDYTIQRVDDENNESGYDGHDEARANSAIPPASIAPYAILVDNYLSIPKIQMQLVWTFVKEAHFPNFTKELRRLRRELLQVARVAPSTPILPSSVCKEHVLVESYVEFLMAMPRSVLKSWIKDSTETPEDQIEDASEIAIDQEEHAEKPLSSMLGKIILDLRTRESRKAKQKRELRLTAFAAHKSALTYKWMESDTILDPLVTSDYAFNMAARRAEEEATATYKVAMTSLITSLRAKENGESPDRKGGMKTTISAPHSFEFSPTWPNSLRLYDSDIVAYACGKYGALETFQEVLRIKSNITRHMDDTVGTYNLLFKLLPSLNPSCGSFLVEFAANEVPHIPIMTSTSTITPFDCMDCSLAKVGGKSQNDLTIEHYPMEIATNFWARWIGDDNIMQALKSSAPKIFEEVESEGRRSRELIEAVRECTITPVELEGKVRRGGCTSGWEDTMHRRDVFSPIILYEAVIARNVPIIVYLVQKKVVTTRKYQDAAEVPLIDLLLEDDKQREVKMSKKCISERTTEELLATREDKADGILSILITLVDLGLSLDGVISSGGKGILKELSDRYGGMKKYKKLLKLWAQKEHSRGTDPDYKYGLMKCLPQIAAIAIPASKRVIAAPQSRSDD